MQELGSHLDIRVKRLAVAVSNAPRLYREIRLDKKGGEHRIINAPEDDLKIVQRSILDTILIRKSVPRCAYGFGKGKSIVDNARLHSGNQYLLNVDIKDFFPSVHFTRVHKLFIALGATGSIAKILTGLTTLNYCLPQGAPTSPYLATLALSNLDRRLSKLCKVNRLTYSRYFDDITISGNERAHQMLATVSTIVAEEGYVIHTGAAKLKFYGPDDEKLVTGILIKDRELCVPNIAEISEYIQALQKNGFAALKDDNPLKEKMSLAGKIAFVSQVNAALGSQLRKEFDTIVW